MIRRVVLWLFMMLLPLQVAFSACHGLAPAASHAAGGDTRDDRPDEPFSHHWLDHGHGAPHHHHDDGSVHHADAHDAQDAQDTQNHTGDHLGCQLTAMPHMGAGLAVQSLPDVAPIEHVAAWRPDPFLHRPARPPHAFG